MKRNTMVLSIIVLLIVSVSSGCLETDNDEVSDIDVNFYIYIQNITSNYTINFSISEIINESILMEPQEWVAHDYERREYNITSGTYNVQIDIQYNGTSYSKEFSIKLDKETMSLVIKFYDLEIKYDCIDGLFYIM